MLSFEDQVWERLHEHRGGIPEGMRPYVKNILESYSELGEEGIRDIRHDLRNHLAYLRKMAESPMGTDFAIQYTILLDTRRACEQVLRQGFYTRIGRLWLNN